MAAGGKAGVCILRFEPEPDRWLVSVSVIWPLDHDNRELARERVRYFSDPEQAVLAVADRLREVFRDSRRPGVRLGISAPAQGSSLEDAFSGNDFPPDDAST